MTVRYLSLCSGIEAASVAWRPLGWEAVAFSEIEPFPCAVLAHHYPDVPNLGDMTQVGDWREYRGAVDLVVAGTPCQDFSIAGKRAGMSGERSGLALVFAQVLSVVRPRWLVWENVPGVFSTNGGRDFGTFLLSAKACAGILRRAEKRGKTLPPALKAALEAVAGKMEPSATLSRG